MKRLILFSLFLSVFQTAFSQTVADALRYSYLQPSGSARFIGVGGAFTALGQDFSCLSTNPAGLGNFRGNDLIITPGLRFSNTSATLRGSSSNLTVDDDKTNFNFTNFGIVFNTEPRNARWKTFNVGIGMNKQANFHSSIYYDGNSRGSIMNNFFKEAKAVFDAGGTAENLYPLGAKLAVDAIAIYQQDSVWTYDFDPTRDATIRRNQAITTTGGINEMVIGFAGNFEDKLSIGATIGVPFFNYKFDGIYVEEDPADDVQYFDNLEFTEYLKTTGIGVNLKLGVNYRVNQMLRLGAAFHTPTVMTLTDNFQNTLRYAYTDGSGQQPGSVVQSPDGTFNYRLRTPWRAMLGAAVLFGKHGFLSADAEVVDYSANKFNLTSDVNNTENQIAERDLNNDVSRAYRQAINLRFGGEAKINQFYLRAGYGLQGKPQDGATGFHSAISGGVGIRGEYYHLEMGIRRAAGKGTIQPYTDPFVSAENQPVADTESAKTDIVLTVGFRF